MKKAKRSLFVLLLCVGLSAAMFTGCALKGSDSKNKERADRFLTEFFTINSDGRNDELMTNFQNNSALFTDEAVLNDALEEYCSGVSAYLTDECLNQLITARTMWNSCFSYRKRRSICCLRWHMRPEQRWQSR